MAVFCVALLEWAGNALGTLASLWATVVLLGGFCSLLSRKDFWFSTVMIFVEASRVFIRNDASVNQWLFGSTRAFRWQELSLRPMLVTPMSANLFAFLIGTWMSGIPTFRPEIVTSIIKMALLVIISQMLSRLRGRFALFLLILLGTAAAIYAAIKQMHILKEKGFKSQLKILGLVVAWDLGTVILLFLAARIRKCARLRKAGALISIKVTTALVLVCLPFFQAILASNYTYFSLSVPLVLLVLIRTPKKLPPKLVESHFFRTLDTIMPILFFWSTMFPLPGISLKLSIYILFSAIAAVLVGNLQIPVAFLQVLLSILRLHSLLGHHHPEYHPLPDGASPNLVPSIVVFFILELCQGSSYMIASLLGLFTLLFRKSLARASGFEKDWGVKAVNLYFHQAYQARTEKGLFRPDKERYKPSLDSFAIESLRSTSSNEMQIVGLRILDHSLRRGDSKSNKKLITEIVKDAKNIITTIIGFISYLTDNEENSGDDTKQKKENAHQKKPVRSYVKYVRIISYLITGGGETSGDTQTKEKTGQKELVRLSLMFVSRLAINGGKISARFRQELSENPFFLDSLEHILNLEDYILELWKPVMDIIASLALDETTRQEIGSTQSIIPKLMHAFLVPNDVNPSKNNNERSLRMVAGEALANLTVMSTDNCWAILLADPEHNLIKNLVNMLEDKHYICVAANLLHNLCANSRDKLKDIDFGANEHLKSALEKVMQIIRTKEGKQLEAALCVTSQIGYVIPEYFSQMLESQTDAAAAELVEKLVETLKSNRKPCPEYPRIRRVLIEVVISISSSAGARYIKIFKEKGAKDALDMVKGTPSKLEKYRVFLDGEGVVAESSHLCVT